ncbi:NAD(P)-dependent dehydrogenase (short-subunit alcohol dehydrogenase family) [Xanthomonas translucens]|nr:NAD(P)-dependent dehydrogenase (short-subunit alcohol dehydrogenase family) [Xanthomonas translucens]
MLTARSQTKADQTRAAILVAAPATRIDVHYVDFSDLSAVAATGRAIARQHPRIDVLINNAGLHAFRQRVSTDGYAEMIAVNYFAPWLLTHVLQATLLRSAPSRIVTVGSQASRQSGGLAIADDLRDVAPFSARGSSRIYGRSKLLDIMFSLELARRLGGSGVSANCLCPGFNVTGLGRELGFARPLARLLQGLDIGNPQRGADGIVRLAVDSVFGSQTGAYVTANAHPLVPWGPANNDAARRQLWDATAEILSRFIAPAPAN